MPMSVTQSVERTTQVSQKRQSEEAEDKDRDNEALSKLLVTECVKSVFL